MLDHLPALSSCEFINLLELQSTLAQLKLSKTRNAQRLEFFTISLNTFFSRVLTLAQGSVIISSYEESKIKKIYIFFVKFSVKINNYSWTNCDLSVKMIL